MADGRKHDCNPVHFEINMISMRTGKYPKEETDRISGKGRARSTVAVRGGRE